MGSALAATTTRRLVALRVFPPTAELPLAVLRPQLAPCIGSKKLAGVEPVLRDGPGEDRGQLARKVRDARTAVVPERPAVAVGSRR